MKKIFGTILLAVLSFSLSFNCYALSHKDWSGDKNDAYEEVNNNVPSFTKDEIANAKKKGYYINLSPLDDLKRVGVCEMCVDAKKLPTKERGNIGTVTPTGWKYNGKSNNNKYDSVSGKYIYNRSHCLGFQLSGLNDEKKNLITGTRFLNVVGMLPFENDVADYVKSTGNHVLYRVTPIFVNDNLLCEGVQMEALSLEDDGAGICFNVFCYNVQPGISINYVTGQNNETGDRTIDMSAGEDESEKTSSTKKVTKKKSSGGLIGVGGGGILFLIVCAIFIFSKIGDNNNNNNNGNNGGMMSGMNMPNNNNMMGGGLFG